MTVFSLLPVLGKGALAAVVLSAAVYGQDGSVPVWVVQGSVFCGFMLVYAVGSAAILAQYAGGSTDAG